jgi:DNA recombination protein RmuC
VDILILIILILCLVGILFLIFRKSESGGSVSIFSENKLDNIQSVMLTEFKNNREEISNQARNGRDELSRSLISALSDFGNKLDKNILSFNELQDKKFNELKDRQTEMLTNTEKQLDKMRETVDEKLTKTLNERLAISFETVSKSLSEVQNGLGEMKALATDVGGLKKVLSHVKTAGIVGEYQLGMLIEQILSPDQYVRNIKFKQRSEHVEFAIKLPGNEDTIYLPIDSKFNQGTYSDLLLAYDSGDKGMIDSAKKIFYSAIETAAKDIQNKYINPPETTDFAIMFLPFEGIYAEVVRNSDLLSKLQVNYKVVIAGPSTLGAMLSTFRMGFRNLAIQKRSGDAWKVLTDVKSEFETFSVLLEKAKKNIETGLNQIGDVSGRQTNKIIKALKDVETLEAPESIKLIEGAGD